MTTTPPNGNESASTRLATAIQAKRANAGISDNDASALKTSLPKLSPISDAASDAFEVRAQLQVETQRRETIAACWERASVPRRHAQPFDIDADSPWGLAYARLSARPELGTILLWGNRGSGKTQLACKLIADRCREARTARYTTAIDLFLDLRAAMHSGDEKDVLKAHQAPSLLVIDDIHERGETGWENRMLFHLLDRRYRDLTDTVLITNEKKPEAIAALGASIVDRLRESGGFVECNWPSFRAAAK